MATDGMMYELSDDGTYYIFAGPEMEMEMYGKLIIAAYYNGLPVREIAPGAFSGQYIDTVVIPKTITTVADSAFSGCSSLRKVYFAGTEEEYMWFTALANCEVYYYSPTKDGSRYWFYYNGEVKDSTENLTPWG
jgi:hypothetical protein